ncbi:3'-5' exonuclease [Pseudomonas sp. MIL19]|uniref:3'-5' exonuclease n=1 Tax=unclassified Pseudomonas TaxID=196821 RepID=UPI001DA56DBE|nr:3'-5' exonuclease [Pseudomonas sp. MIL19]MBU0806969.1 3'-5' exonuclease [Gammaproteobacteria bacterium]MBU0901785.1 3'-5' exonuclease [Gammaproteobacteria bacterium]MDD2160376.1 3'-5' exonuclease [Pseudomonas sp. MIL19]
MLADSIAVLDFETTGMSPAQQARATEIGVVIVEGGQIVARYQSLMNSGAWVPPFIEQLTGISNAMLRTAPPAAQVMQEVAAFVGDRPLLAHNASFDQKFWDAELALIRRQRVQPFACSLLLSRRLLPMAPSHKLGNLNRWAGLPDTGQAHRALADAEMAANLTCFMAALLRERHGIADISHELLCNLQRVPAAKMSQALQKIRDHARG